MSARTEIGKPSTATESLALGAGQLVWSAVRLPLLGVLVMLEPIVRVLCSLVMVLGVIASVVFEISAVGPRFPFIGMLALSLTFGVFLFLYYGLIALLSR